MQYQHSTLGKSGNVIVTKQYVEHCLPGTDV
jgi:hypothetical protein